MKPTNISKENVPMGDERGTLQRVPLIPLVSLGIGFIFVYYQVFWMMIIQWWTDEMYSYCFLIPLLSCYMIWVRRDSLYDIPVHPNSRLGVLSLMVGFIMLLAGHAGKISALQQLSIIPGITGIISLTLGSFFLRNIWVSIAYLLFMLPIWEFITDRLHFPFQTLTADIGVALIGSIGIPAYRQGVFLELPNVTLEVARACSGINYLIAVAALGIPMAHLFLDKWSKKILLVISSLLIAVLANGLRVALIGVLSYYGITKEIHGPHHVLHGLFVSFVGYAAIFGGLWLISGNNLTSQEIPSQVAYGRFAGRMPQNRSSLSNVILMFALLLFILTGSYINFYKMNSIPLKTDFKFFPNKIEKWIGTDIDLNSHSIKSSTADKSLTRIYRMPSGNEVFVNVNYFNSQDDKKKLVTFDHEMIKLHQISVKTTINIGQARQIVVNKAIQSSETGSTMIFFWYDINGRIITNPFLAKGYNLLDSLSNRKNNGAIITVSFKLDNQDNAERDMLSGMRFISDLYLTLDNYLP